MNRNYKVIWNRSLGCFTAVAEYAKSRGKSSKSSVSSNATINTTSNLSSMRIFRTTTIWLGLITAGFSMQAIAAPCTGATSVVCGTNATASPSYGVAIGKNSTAQGTQAIAIGGGLTGQPTTASGEQSIAIGANVVSSGNSSIAIGGDDLSDVANIAGINGLFNAYTTTSNRNLIQDVNNPYNGHTQSSGAASVAIGVKAQSKGALSTAVGVRSSSSGDASSAFGMGASASKKGSVALGAGSTTDYNATFQEKLTIGNKDYYYAGATKDLGAQVSVGSVGKERQIKHVAAGAVDRYSTDAVNGSQLHATNQSINDLSERKITFAGDSGTPVARKLGETLNIKGGATNLTNNNIGVVADGSGTLTVKLAKDIDLGATGSVKMGSSALFGLGLVTTIDSLGMRTGDIVANTNVNALGVFIKGPLDIIPSVALTSNGLNIFNGPSVTKTGIDAGNKKVTRILAGTVSANSTDAINGSQLFDTDSIAKGNMAALGGGAAYNPNTNVYTQPTYTLNNNADVFNNVGDALDNLDSRTTTNAVDIANNYDAINNLNNGTAGIVRQDAITGDITVGAATGGSNVNFAGTDGERVLSGIAAGLVDTDAVNVGQLNAQATGVAGIIGGDTTYDSETGTFTNNDIGGTGESSIHEAIKSVKGDVAASKTTVTKGKNIVVSETPNTNGSSNYEVKTADDLDITSVKAGNSVLNTAGLNVNNGTNSASYDATGASLIDGAGNTNNSTALGNTITNGTNVTTITANGTNVTNGINSSNYGANGFTATGAGGSTVVNQAGVSFTNNSGAATGPSITAGGINAAGRITGVEDGADPKDAVNYSQLMGMQRDVGNSISELGYNMGRSIDDLGYRIGEVEDDANAGISAAMAMSSLPQAYIIGKSMIGGGIANYNGESAVAIGFSKLSDDGRWVMKLNGTADTQGNVGAAIGAGFHFK